MESSLSIVIFLSVNFFQICVVQPIFNKGDISDYANYRGISLLNVSYRIYVKVIVARIQSTGMLLEKQNWFRKGRSCIHNIFSLQ